MQTPKPSDVAASTHEPFVTITLAFEDAQRLYDHTGTMPYAPGSWSNNVRDELSSALAEAWGKPYREAITDDRA